MLNDAGGNFLKFLSWLRSWGWQLTLFNFFVIIIEYFYLPTADAEYNCRL